MPDKPIVRRGETVLGTNPLRFKMVRESRGMTRKNLVALIRCDLADMTFDRYAQIEAGGTFARPTRTELDAIAKATHYPVDFFMQDDPPEFGEGSLRWHSRLIICDLCEREWDIDDERAETKCAACKLDLCRAHANSYTVEVAAPHGETVRVKVCDYCDACQRRLVSYPKRKATLAANREKRLREAQAGRA